MDLGVLLVVMQIWEKRGRTVKGAMSQSDQIWLTEATNTSTSTNYAGAAFDLLPYNMESATLTIGSNSK